MHRGARRKRFREQQHRVAGPRQQMQMSRRPARVERRPIGMPLSEDRCTKCGWPMRTTPYRGQRKRIRHSCTNPRCGAWHYDHIRVGGAPTNSASTVSNTIGDGLKNALESGWAT